MKKILIVAMLAVGAIAYPFLLLGALDISLVQIIQKQIGGPWEEYYENGQLEKSGAYKNGRRHGPWKYFYEEVKKAPTKKANETGFGNFMAAATSYGKKQLLKTASKTGFGKRITITGSYTGK